MANNPPNPPNEREVTMLSEDERHRLLASLAPSGAPLSSSSRLDNYYALLQWATKARVADSMLELLLTGDYQAFIADDGDVQIRHK